MPARSRRGDRDGPSDPASEQAGRAAASKAARSSSPSASASASRRTVSSRGAGCRPRSSSLMPRCGSARRVRPGLPGTAPRPAQLPQQVPERGPGLRHRRAASCPGWGDRGLPSVCPRSVAEAVTSHETYSCSPSCARAVRALSGEGRGRGGCWECAGSRPRGDDRARRTVQAFVTQESERPHRCSASLVRSVSVSVSPPGSP